MVNGCGLRWRNGCFPGSLVLVGGKSDSRLSTWYTECRKAFLLFRRSVNANGFGTIASFYSKLVESRRDVTLGETQGFDDSQLDSQFERKSGQRR